MLSNSRNILDSVIGATGEQADQEMRKMHTVQRECGVDLIQGQADTRGMANLPTESVSLDFVFER